MQENLIDSIALEQGEDMPLLLVHRTMLSARQLRGRPGLPVAALNGAKETGPQARAE